MSDKQPPRTWTGRVPTWRDGVELTMEERALLEPEQTRQWQRDSVVRADDDIDAIPGRWGDWVRAQMADSAARLEAQLAEQERRGA